MASAQGEAVWYPQVLVEPSSAVPVPINATARPRPAARPGSAGAGPPRVSARNDRLAVSRRRPALRVFIYRRTHTGDPCRCGIFGVYDCMGRFRSRDFDAVLGVGVDSPDRRFRGDCRSAHVGGNRTVQAPVIGPAPRSECHVRPFLPNGCQGTAAPRARSSPVDTHGSATDVGLPAIRSSARG